MRIKGVVCKYEEIKKKLEAKEVIPEQGRKAIKKENKKTKKVETGVVSESSDFNSSKTIKKFNISNFDKIYFSILALAFVLIGAISLILTKVVIITNAMSGSMEPTIMTGDKQLYNQLAYKFHPIERGDIIVFWSSEEDILIGKRVISLPGDEISFENGDVYINGLRLEESYLPEGVETYCIKSFCVPEGCVFVLGDNREISKDSRFFENPYIPMSDIKGKFCMILKKAEQNN